MSPHPIVRSVAVIAVAAVLASALAGPSLARPDKEARAAARVEAKAAREQAKAERHADKQAAKQVRADARTAREQARLASRVEKQAAKQAKADAKATCKKGGWEALFTAEGDAFPNQGQCVKYAVHGGTPRPPETVLAIAYANLNGTPGYQADGVDVLISRLVDTDANGADEGDRIDMGRYPTDTDATAFGAFTVTTHTVTSVGVPDQTGYKVYSSSGTHVWLDFVNAEMYYEENPLTQVRDGFTGYTEALSADTGSASRPDTPVSATYPTRLGDDPFVDVDIY